MLPNIMVLPLVAQGELRLVTIPPDLDKHEAYRSVTTLIAAVEDEGGDYDWSSIEEKLEEHGFESVDFTLGPEINIP